MKFLAGTIQRGLQAALQYSLQHYFESLPEIRIVQIGANDGEKLDPVADLIKKFPCKALLVEPIPILCQKLQQKYRSNARVRILQKAIAPLENQGAIPFYHLEKKEGLPFNDDFMLWGSFSREHLDKFRKVVPHFEELVTCSQVPTLGINGLLKESGFEQVDYLQIDAEGYDEQLVNAIDLDRFKPTLIRFEHLHSNRKMVLTLLEKLKRAGYQTYSLGMDTICIYSKGKKYFRMPRLIKVLHGNWLMPAAPSSKSNF